MSERGLTVNVDELLDNRPRDPILDWLRIPDGFLSGVWVAHEPSVNLDDLVRAGRPGAIIRIRKHGALQYIPPTLDGYERVAGLISDAA